ncbi:hypothetical protein A9P82_05850 [Arachidicoccus ginsenosidimutans]|uniref:TlpA family protein disulfide reductase n=1 Tax=Arachidicoccus sp. BS20 TaxID=1850526 RepID=UPI0007F15268|nr:redoxin family protein [Arachidicoccus sp. BS20]ANI88854.1 hypothetical protein A9P82_05850 [Arachidicoccus sp. BS20]
MKTILLVPAFLCLYLSAIAQSNRPFYTGERVPDITLHHIINYKNSSAALSSFGHKLIILDFWGIHCGSCIAMFPLEDSLQKAFGKNVQFILVTSDSLNKTLAFIQQWKQKHHSGFSPPIVTEDHLLRKLFWHYYVPHYAWLAPDGSLLAQTLDNFINAEVIKNMLLSIQKNEQHLKDERAPSDAFGFKEPTQKQTNLFTQIQNKK